mmetsp:Transcript_14783/g.34903  ORF Transcript_14783/g.34903 Transcript_14783/m.34903 type:complete len:207 (-) Transcript_14783:509-1129(-)
MRRGPTPIRSIDRPADPAARAQCARRRCLLGVANRSQQQGGSAPQSEPCHRAVAWATRAECGAWDSAGLAAGGTSQSARAGSRRTARALGERHRVGKPHEAAPQPRGVPVADARRRGQRRHPLYRVRTHPSRFYVLRSPSSLRAGAGTCAGGRCGPSWGRMGRRPESSWRVRSDAHWWLEGLCYGRLRLEGVQTQQQPPQWTSSRP